MNNINSQVYQNKSKDFIKISQMIQKLSNDSQAHFDEHLNHSVHKLLFQKGQKLHPQQHECILISYLGCRTDTLGKIRLTDFRIIFEKAKENQGDDTSIKFDFPIGYLSKCQGTTETVNKTLVFYVQFLMKFGFSLKIKSAYQSLLKITDHINLILNQYDSFGEKRAANIPQQQKCKKWEEVCFGHEGDISEAAVYDNQAWKHFPTYPETFKVPKPFVGKRNQHDRLVLLSYVHQSKKPVGLWKSGPGKPDMQQQKWVPSAAKKQDHIVVEVKTKVLGSNKSLAQHMIQLDGPIQLRESFMKFFIATCYENQQQSQSQKWLININISRWYEQIQIIISEAFLLLQKLCKGVNITILSDWDARGSQICSLIQVLAKPENRTINGFGRLIQRQFLHFGNYTHPGRKNERFEDKGIALIQFLDCVFQITKMYPLSFQFNEDMLTYIAIHVYSRKYGNFLYFTRAITQLNVQKFVKYGCIWSKIDKQRQQFTNPYFVDHKQCDIYELNKNVGMKNFRIWGSFFLRDILMYGNNIQINKLNVNQRILLKRHYQIKNETQSLRMKLAEQHKTIHQKKQKLKQLQKLQLD